MAEDDPEQNGLTGENAEYGAESIKVLRGLDAVRNGRACILAIPTMAPACII